MPEEKNSPQKEKISFYNKIKNPAILIILLYFFFAAIAMMGSAFEHYGGFVATLVKTTDDPFMGLMIGVLVTSIVQSSSLTTSIVVTLVGGGFPITNAIPIVMGANIGSSVTSMIVSIAHMSRRDEFERALSAATVHDFFNVIMVIILFPIEMKVHYLERLSKYLFRSFLGGITSGITFESPIKVIAGQPGKFLWRLFNYVGLPQFISEIIIFLIAIALLFVTLYYIVKVMRIVIVGKAEKLIDSYVFKNGITALACGILMTAIIQSSAVTISMALPLVAAGLITLEKAFPYILGANVGTTVTALLATFAADKTEPAVCIGLVHFLFNTTGVAIFFPLKPIRQIPINLSRWFASVAVRSKYIAFLYIAILFFVIPITFIFLHKYLTFVK